MNFHQGNLHPKLLSRLFIWLILAGCLLSACALPRGNGAIPTLAPGPGHNDDRRFNRNASLAARN